MAHWKRWGKSGMRCVSEKGKLLPNSRCAKSKAAKKARKAAKGCVASVGVKVRAHKRRCPKK